MEAAWANPDMYHGFISLNIKCEPGGRTTDELCERRCARRHVEDGAIYRGHEKMALPIERKGASVIGHGHRTIKGSKVLYNTKVPGLNR